MRLPRTADQFQLRDELYRRYGPAWLNRLAHTDETAPSPESVVTPDVVRVPHPAMFRGERMAALVRKHP
jgi:hypothetical protein